MLQDNQAPLQLNPTEAYKRALHTTLAVTVFAIATLCLWQLFKDTSLKYILYFMPPVFLLINVVIQRGVLDVDPRAATALCLYAVMSMASLAATSKFDFFAQRDTIIICGYLALFALPIRVLPSLADGVLVTLIAACLVVAYNDGVVLQFDLLGSKGIMETNLAFPIGILLIYYVFDRSWTRALITFALFFITFKRIAILAFMVVLAIEFVIWVTADRLSRRFVATSIALSACIASVFMIEIVEYLAFYLNIDGINAAALSLGRTNFAAPLWEQIHAGSIDNLLFGFGPGGADRALWVVRSGANPHNDWLKVLFEYGYIGLILFHVVMYMMFPRGRVGTALYIYTAIIFTTDNTLIYMQYFAFVALIAHLPFTLRRTQIVPMNFINRQTDGVFVR